MKTYNEFLVEKELQPINESILYFSPQMREDLGKVKHPIAKAILSMEGTDRKEDITFIDVSPQEGFVTFKTMKSMLNDIEKEAIQTLIWLICLAGNKKEIQSKLES
jgi:hypothetical protein